MIVLKKTCSVGSSFSPLTAKTMTFITMISLNLLFRYQWHCRHALLHLRNVRTSSNITIPLSPSNVLIHSQMYNLCILWHGGFFFSSQGIIKNKRNIYIFNSLSCFWRLQRVLDVLIVLKNPPTWQKHLYERCDNNNRYVHCIPGLYDTSMTEIW